MEELNIIGVESAAYEIQVYDSDEFIVQAEKSIIVYQNAARQDYITDLVVHRFEALIESVHTDGLPMAQILCHCGVYVTVYTSDLLEGELLLDAVYTEFAGHQVAQFGGMI